MVNFGSQLLLVGGKRLSVALVPYAELVSAWFGLCMIISCWIELSNDPRCDGQIILQDLFFLNYLKFSLYKTSNKIRSILSDHVGSWSFMAVIFEGYKGVEYIEI